MVTIKDIALATGVSATTVSNVIHGKANRVSPETLQKIRDANFMEDPFHSSAIASIEQPLL